MPLELKKTQIRIRVKSPKLFKKFKTLDVGKKGRLQIIRAKNSKGWQNQSYRINTKDYRNKKEILKDINSLKISLRKKKQARALVRKILNSRP